VASYRVNFTFTFNFYQQNAHFLINVLIQFLLSSTCFEHLMFIFRKTILYMQHYMVCFLCIYAGLPKNSGNLTIKKFITVTPSFHCLLRSSPQKFGEFKQSRRLLRRRLWKLGVTVGFFMAKFPEFLGRPSYMRVCKNNTFIWKWCERTTFR
jgi:hypothetical protein